MNNTSNKNEIRTEILKDTYKICSKCGNFISCRQSFEYCNVCGEKFLTECPECYEPIIYPISKFCPSCGKKLIIKD